MERERRSEPGRDRSGRRSTASSRLPVVTNHLIRRCHTRERSGVHVKPDSGSSSLTHVEAAGVVQHSYTVTGDAPTSSATSPSGWQRWRPKPWRALSAVNSEALWTHRRGNHGIKSKVRPLPLRQRRWHRAVQRSRGGQRNLQRTDAEAGVATPDPNAVAALLFPRPEMNGPVAFGVVQWLRLWPEGGRSRSTIQRDCAGPQTSRAVRLAR